jgi:hypothetical protein
MAPYTHAMAMHAVHRKACAGGVSAFRLAQNAEMASSWRPSILLEYFADQKPFRSGFYPCSCAQEGVRSRKPNFNCGLLPPKEQQQDARSDEKGGAPSNVGNMMSESC